MTKNEKYNLYQEAITAGFEGSFHDFEDASGEFVPFSASEIAAYEEACLGNYKGSLSDYRKLVADQKKKKEAK